MIVRAAAAAAPVIEHRPRTRSSYGVVERRRAPAGIATARRPGRTAGAGRRMPLRRRRVQASRSTSRRATDDRSRRDRRLRAAGAPERRSEHVLGLPRCGRAALFAPARLDPACPTGAEELGESFAGTAAMYVQNLVPGRAQPGTREPRCPRPRPSSSRSRSPRWRTATGRPGLGRRSTRCCRRMLALLGQRSANAARDADRRLDERRLGARERA